jgi:hypothetical protein
VTITLRCDSPLDLSETAVTLTGVATMPEIGELVSATGFETTSSPSVLRGRWDSQVLEWAAQSRR